MYREHIVGSLPGRACALACLHGPIMCLIDLSNTTLQSVLLIAEDIDIGRNSFGNVGLAVLGRTDTNFQEGLLFEGGR